MKARLAVALIDGEHYPPVVADTLAGARDRYDFQGALFLGGTEKIQATAMDGAEAANLYGVPVVFAKDWISGLQEVLGRFQPEVVVDLSDEPVLGYKDRFRLASYCLAEGVAYVGSDFHFNPVSEERLCASPSLSVVGTGKRTGKTAISGFLARTLKGVVPPATEGRPNLVVVAMGRGGPAEPEVIDGAAHDLTAEDLLAWSQQGKHAASDCYEDALLNQVVTIGCRRCGGGLAGEPFASNVPEGVQLANSLRPGFVILEGSGASLPPVKSDVRVLVCGAQQSVEYVAGYLGTYRVLTSDAVVVTMAEEPLVSRERVQALIEAIGAIKGKVPVVCVVLRPWPVKPVAGKEVAFFTTAPAVQREVLCRYLEDNFACRVRLFSAHLSDRAALAQDLQQLAMNKVDAVLCEIKAAAVDMMVAAAAERGLETVFVDNIPIEVAPSAEGDLRALATVLYQKAVARFGEEG